uniref:Putative secreted protein n=1 Tax=Anopheles triannulatus TaxID=58253 RepID=A0A2M4B6J3_9DIPT
MFPGLIAAHFVAFVQLRLAFGGTRRCIEAQQLPEYQLGPFGFVPGLMLHPQARLQCQGRTLLPQALLAVHLSR